VKVEARGSAGARLRAILREAIALCMLKTQNPQKHRTRLKEEEKRIL
jgi:hypothetical protein